MDIGRSAFTTFLHCSVLFVNPVLTAAEGGHQTFDIFSSVIVDNYVHRLVASKTDGKMVQYECEGDSCQAEKIDALQLEVSVSLSPSCCFL